MKNERRFCRNHRGGNSFCGSRGVATCGVAGHFNSSERSPVELGQQAAGRFMQLSDEPLKTVINKFDLNSLASKAVDNALLDGTLVKTLAYVDKVTNELKILKVNI